MAIVEDLIYNAVPDEAILENLKADMLKERADAKLNQGMCFSALQTYVMLGPDYVKSTTLTDKQISELTSEELLSKIRNLMDCVHEVSYYGPASVSQVETLLRENHRIAADLKPLEKVMPVAVETPTSRVYLAQYDAKQIYYLQLSNNGEKLDVANDPYIKLYNEYFGGGMNAIVFQEMREARGLAYSAMARLVEPEYKDDSYKYYAFIATQNDKMKTAIEAFDEIINDMPESETAFNIAKEALMTTLRTERITGRRILYTYHSTRALGLTENRSKQIYEVLPTLTFEDVKATQKKWVEGRTYHYGILGDIKDLDTKYLSTLGPVHTLTLEEIFGY
jgi:predicted Zn-dependent peptidase